MGRVPEFRTRDGFVLSRAAWSSMLMRQWQRINPGAQWGSRAAVRRVPSWAPRLLPSRASLTMRWWRPRVPEALALAQDLHVGRVTIALDCLGVINALKQPFEGSSAWLWRSCRQVQDVRRRPPLSMKIALWILKRIDWHILLFLVVLDDRFGFYSPLPVFVYITMFNINKVPWFPKKIRYIRFFVWTWYPYLCLSMTSYVIACF
jgi:hypothetical protein